MSPKQGFVASYSKLRCVDHMEIGIAKVLENSFLRSLFEYCTFFFSIGDCFVVLVFVFLDLMSIHL